MNREISFRGKRIDDGEWVYGSFCMDALEQFNGLCGVDGFIRLYDKDSGKMQMYEVDRETVGQFTGLIDKNGTKIFEGDILRIEWKVAGRTPVHEIHIVLYRKSGFFTVNNGLLKGQLSNYACSNCRGLSAEVIGNIHGNPEMLEGGVEVCG